MVKTFRAIMRKRLYDVWRQMVERCENDSHKAYKRYGGRGVRVCDEWRKSFYTFRDWATQAGYCANVEIDRINVRGNYEPMNCRWVNSAQQVVNRGKASRSSASSPFKGVAKWQKGWRSRVSFGHVTHNLGMFNTQIEAALAYDDAAIKLHGQFANLNFPERYRTQLGAMSA